jgi:hypothetical protein
LPRRPPLDLLVGGSDADARSPFPMALGSDRQRSMIRGMRT